MIFPPYVISYVLLLDLHLSVSTSFLVLLHHFSDFFYTARLTFWGKEIEKAIRLLQALEDVGALPKRLKSTPLACTTTVCTPVVLLAQLYICSPDFFQRSWLATSFLYWT